MAADQATCQARDPKGLWRAHAHGELPELPDAASYEPPTAAEITAAGGDDAAAVRAVLGRLALA